jgi:glucose-1-phosphate cytidylyltransferase
MGQSKIRINGGYFVFKHSIFDYIQDGEELVQEPFRRLIQERNLLGYAYDGFWKSMDTFKEKQELDDLYSKGVALWQLWKRPTSNGVSKDYPEKEEHATVRP